MAFLIGGANSAADDAYSIENSLRFNSGDSPVLTDTLGTPTDIDKFTISLWFKRGILYNQAQTGQCLINCYRGDTSNPFGIVAFGGDDQIQFHSYDDAYTSILILNTNRVFRDPSAWYHIVCAVDTSQGVAANRAKLYINGVQETSFATATYPDQNKDLAWNQSATVHYIGKYQYTGATFWDGYQSEFYFIDGQQLTPSDFGETHSSGIWIPKDAKDDLTFGDNGYYLEFKQTGTDQDASGIGADTSGNDNHFAVTNLAATDICTDSPTNNFCTFNPTLPMNSTMTISEGNLRAITGSTYGDNVSNSWVSNIGMATGKWYAEFLCNSVSGADDASGQILGVCHDLSAQQKGSGGSAYNFCFRMISGWGYAGWDGGYGHATTQGTLVSTVAYGDAWAGTDIVGIALDMDNNKLYFSKNGTWQNSGDPESGATGTGALSITSGEEYFFAFSDASGGNVTNVSANFGNPPYANSSSVADENGYGAFEYAVPSGYYALCTKNLAEYG